MILNTTLLRLDPPPPAPQGPALSIRCAATQPTGDQQAMSNALSLAAVLVLYLPMNQVPPAGPPVVDGRIHLRLDGCPAATYRVAHVQDRAGPLSHLQVFLAPV